MGIAWAARRLALRRKTQALQGLQRSNSNFRWIGSTANTDKMVFSFGDGSHGALGLPSGGDAYEPTQVERLPSHINSVAAGHYHSLAITHQGEVWAWGRNEEGQLGRGLGVPRESWNQPKIVQGLDKVEVINAAASGVVSMAIGKDGALWVWGKSKRGQLGLGKGITEALIPQRVEALAGQEIVQVHSFSDNGCLFSFGDNNYGQLGRSLQGSHLQPVDLNQKVVSIAAGLGHSLAITMDQLSSTQGGESRTNASCTEELNTDIFSWGWNSTSQLGRSGGEMTSKPGKVTGLGGKKPVAVSGGRAHSVAITSEWELWVWGCGRNGRLGLGSSIDEPEPYPVENLEGVRIFQAVCGFDHNLLLVDV